MSWVFGTVIAATGAAWIVYRLISENKVTKAEAERAQPLGSGAGQPESAKQEGGDEEAQKLKRCMDNYNYRRAMELLDSSDEEQAFEYLKRAIADDAENGVAYLYLGKIYMHHRDYGQALRCLNLAIAKLPGVKLSSMYVFRAEVYRNLGKLAESEADAKTAIEMSPEDPHGYDSLAELYYMQGRYEESNEQIDRLMKVDESTPYGPAFKGRNELQMKHYEQAHKLFGDAIALDSSYGHAYSYDAEALLEMGRINEAADAEMTALRLDIESGIDDDKAYDLIPRFANVAKELFELRVKGMVARGEHYDRWVNVLGVFYSWTRDHKEAAQCFRLNYEHLKGPQFLDYESSCWREAGNFSRAADLLEQMLLEMPDNIDKQLELVTLKVDMGLMDEALEMDRELLRRHPDMPDIYNSMGRVLQLCGRHEEAIEYLGKSLLLDKQPQAYTILKRAMSNVVLGNIEAVVIDCEAIIVHTEFFGHADCKPMALLLKGETGAPLQEAMEQRREWLAELQHAYDNLEVSGLVLQNSLVMSAALLSRMGKTDEAVAELRKTFEVGGARFHFYRHCLELEPLRSLDCFEPMLQAEEMRCQATWGEEWASVEEMVTPDDGAKMEASYVPFSREGGICKVPCTINSLPLHFVFDTGASDVTMSTVEATFMLKNGFLHQHDLSGKEYYMTANGEVAEGTKVRLREVNFAGLRLDNVKASVVKSQRAPLLLGQSVLSRLGRIEIDNEHSQLTIFPTAN